MKNILRSDHNPFETERPSLRQEALKPALLLFILMPTLLLITMQSQGNPPYTSFAILIAVLLLEMSFAGIYLNSSSKFAWRGKKVLLVKDGVLQLDKLQLVHLTPSQLFAKLRAKNVSKLKDVERLYMERGGYITISKAVEEEADLTVLPGIEAAQ